MRIGILGINHKLADLKLRETLAKVCNRKFASGYALDSKHAFVLLSTCNRTEIYFSSEDLSDTHSYLLRILRAEVDEEFDQKLYSYFGVDCFSHLCQVTSGLDSAILAETEIQGQVKCAYESTKIYGQLPFEMHFLFQKALQVGKQVRSQLSLGRGMPDIEHSVFQLGEQFFPSAKNAQVLFVGASAINCKIMYYLKAKGISSLTLCNRSYEKAEYIAKKASLPILRWENLSSWSSYDWIIFGTKSPYFLLSEVPEDLSPKLIMDLSVPRNVDPKVGRKMTLLNIDQINGSLAMHQQQRQHLLLKANSLIGDLAGHHVHRFQRRQFTPFFQEATA